MSTDRIYARRLQIDDRYPRKIIDFLGRTEVPTYHLRALLEENKRRPPETLFHYTRQESAHLILTSGELWTAHIRFLGDSREFAEALKIIRELLESFVAKTEPSAKPVLQHLIDTLGYLDDVAVLVGSFSDRDNESQWKKYAPSGYALGFSPNRLERSEPNDSYSLYPVFYEKALHAKLCHAVIQDAMKSYTGAIQRGLDPEEALDATRIGFEVAVVTIAPLMKDPSFSDEHEWRVVSLPLHVEQLPLRTRMVDRLMVPHGTFKIRTESGHLLNEVMIGPPAKAAQLIDGLKWSLVVNGFEGTEISTSAW